MAFEQVVPVSSPVWDVDYRLDQTVTTVPVASPAVANYAGGVPNTAVKWAVETGVPVQIGSPAFGPVIRLGDTGGANQFQRVRFGGAAVILGTLPAGCITPAHARVSIWSFLVRFVAPTGTFGVKQGFGLVPAGTAGGLQFDVDAGIATSGEAIGVFGNGAGGLAFIRKALAGVGNVENLGNIAWPVALTSFVHVELVVVAGTPSGPAVFTLWLNGRPTVHAQAWGADGTGTGNPQLNTTGGALATVGGLLLGVQMDSVLHPGMRLDLWGLRFRQGRFLPDGVAVTGS